MSFIFLFVIMFILNWTDAPFFFYCSLLFMIMWILIFEPFYVGENVRKTCRQRRSTSKE